MKKLLLLAAALGCLQACDHPLEIEGQGDIVSQSGTRDCSLEDYQAGAENCTRNTVLGEYSESYTGVPRDGWILAGWKGCGYKSFPECSYNIPSSVVQDYWGQVMPAARAIFVRPLNDTGQIIAADPTDNFYFNDCAGFVPEDLADQQDCASGRDVTHFDSSDGWAGFSFTKLDADGNDLPADAVSWSCVRDNVTGLLWEHKTDDDSIHDKDNRYRWGGIGADPYDTEFYDDWNTLVTGTNNEALCGFTDWRVPAINELESLLNLDPGPYIVIQYFPNLSNTMVLWSTTALASGPGDASSGDENRAWGVQLTIGGLVAPRSRDGSLVVQLVRSEP
jgi:hypothetical protein